MKIKTILFFIIFISIIKVSYADNVEVLTNDKDEYNFKNSTYILEDKTGTLTIDDLLTESKYKDSFEKAKSAKPNFGYTSSVYWIKNTLVNKSNKDNWIIIFNYILTDEIKLYLVDLDNKVITEKKGGENYPFNIRNIKYRKTNFLVNACSIPCLHFYLDRINCFD